jgi:hypothetical protein
VVGKGKDTISGASTMEFDSRVGTSKTVGNQNINFTGGGTLLLNDPAARSPTSQQATRSTS